MNVTTAAYPLTHRIALDDPRRCWLIESGEVDLFLLDQRADGAAQSSLAYVGSIAAGSLLLGLGALPDDSANARSASNGSHARGRTLLAAQPSPGTTVRPLRMERSPDASDELLDDELLDKAELLDGWIAALAGFCSPGQPPPLSRQVEPGDCEDESGDEPRILIGKREVTWVQSAAPLEFFGAQEEDTEPAESGDTAEGTTFAPVSRSLWVRVPAGAAFTCRSTADWMLQAHAEGTLVRGLQAFHLAMLRQRRQQRAEEEQRDRIRFRNKLESDGGVFGSALQGLLAPLAPVGGSPATILAADASDSAAASALAACRAVGRSMGITITAPASTPPDDSASEAVLRVIRASSVRHRRVLLRDSWWKNDQGPMIGFTQDGAAAVALLQQGASRYSLVDPVTGKRTRINDAVAAQLNAYAMVLYRPFPNRKLTLADLFTFGLRNGWKDMAIIIAVSAITSVLALAMPIATGVLFDQIIPEGQRGNLVQLSVILLSASIAIFLMGLGQSFATQRLEGRMESEMEAALWDRLLNMRTGFFRQFTTGDLASRSLAVNQIRELLTGHAVSALLTGVFSVFSLALLFRYSVGLALLGVGLVSIAIAVSALSTWISIRLRRKTLAMDGRIVGRVAELLGGVAKFRVAGAEPTAFARWAEEYAVQEKTRMLAARISMGLGVFDGIFPAATTIVIFLSAADMMKQNPAFSVGNFLAFNAAFGQFLGSTLGFSSALLSVIGIVPVYERAKPILEELPELKPNLLDPGPLSGTLELSHVHFRYKPDGPLILNDVSFSIKAGQYVAFVGESGCGKSTIMRLLLGFELPETGSVSYDGRDLAELDMQAVRRQIGVVLQSGKLMAADVYSNIIGPSTLSLDDAWEAARRAGVDEDIRAMPMGMHTVISESGGGISGGQRQRLLIARAIVHRPRILFFDEATSALDNQTQAVVSSSLDAMQSTRIVIAHRLSTIQQADQILVFKQGKLHETGTYRELLDKGGYFAELAQRQLT